MLRSRVCSQVQEQVLERGLDGARNPSSALLAKIKDRGLTNTTPAFPPSDKSVDGFFLIAIHSETIYDLFGTGR